MEIFTELLAFPNLLFCVAIWIIVLIQRKIIAKIWKGAETNKWYREIFLPLGPIGTGMLLAAFVTTYPFPMGFVALGPRIIYGMVCGLLSAHVYKMVRGFINKKKAEVDSGTGPDLITAEGVKEEVEKLNQ